MVPMPVTRILWWEMEIFLWSYQTGTNNEFQLFWCLCFYSLIMFSRICGCPYLGLFFKLNSSASDINWRVVEYLYLTSDNTCPISCLHPNGSGSGSRYIWWYPNLLAPVDGIKTDPLIVMWVSYVHLLLFLPFPGLATSNSLKFFTCNFCIYLTFMHVHLVSIPCT